MNKTLPMLICIGLLLVLACANPVKIGLKGLKTDLDNVSSEVKKGKSIMEQASDIERQIKESPSEYLVGKIDALKGQIREIVSLEMRLGSIADSLAVLEMSPKATETIKEEISLARNLAENLKEDIVDLRETDAKLGELRAYILSVKTELKEKTEVEKPVEKTEEKEESERKKIEKKTY